MRFWRWSMIVWATLHSEISTLSALKQGASDSAIVFLRSLQSRPDKVPKAIVKQLTQRQRNWQDWNQLARTYLQLGDCKNAIINYCKGIAESLEQGNVFSAGFYLR